MAIDDFHMTLGFAPVPETNVWSAAGLYSGAFILFKRRRSRRA
jgi:hypothetical protein